MKLPVRVLLSALIPGGLFALVGAFVIAISLDVIHTDPADFHAPRIVVAAFGLVFFLAGTLVFQQRIAAAFGQDSTWIRWSQFILILVTMLAFSSIFLWTGFGSGERVFTQSTRVGPVTPSSPGSDASDRLFFGGFGVLMLLAALAFAILKNPSRQP